MLHGWELIAVVFIVVLLFGARKIPELGKGLGRGIRSFKEGLGGKSDEEAEQAKPKQIESGEAPGKNAL